MNLSCSLFIGHENIHMYSSFLIFTEFVEGTAMFKKITNQTSQ